MNETRLATTTDVAQLKAALIRWQVGTMAVLAALCAAIVRWT
jgi:hypothetical protein